MGNTRDSVGRSGRLGAQRALQDTPDLAAGEQLRGCHPPPTPLYLGIQTYNVVCCLWVSSDNGSGCSHIRIAVLNLTPSTLSHLGAHLQVFPLWRGPGFPLLCIQDIQERCRAYGSRHESLCLYIFTIKMGSFIWSFCRQILFSVFFGLFMSAL